MPSKFQLHTSPCGRTSAHVLHSVSSQASPSDSCARRSNRSRPASTYTRRPANSIAQQNRVKPSHKTTAAQATRLPWSMELLAQMVFIGHDFSRAEKVQNAAGFSPDGCFWSPSKGLLIHPLQTR